MWPHWTSLWIHILYHSSLIHSPATISSVLLHNQSFIICVSQNIQCLSTISCTTCLFITHIPNHILSTSTRLSISSHHSSSLKHQQNFPSCLIGYDPITISLSALNNSMKFSLTLISLSIHQRCVLSDSRNPFTILFLATSCHVCIWVLTVNHSTALAIRKRTRSVWMVHRLGTQIYGLIFISLLVIYKPKEYCYSKGLKTNYTVVALARTGTFAILCNHSLNAFTQ